MEDALNAFEPYVCTFSEEDGLHFVTCPEIHLMVWGDTRSEAIEAALFVREALIMNYVAASEDELTPDAIAFRHILQKMAA